MRELAARQHVVGAGAGADAPFEAADARGGAGEAADDELELGDRLRHRGADPPGIPSRSTPAAGGALPTSTSSVAAAAEASPARLVACTSAHTAPARCAYSFGGTTARVAPASTAV